MEIITAQDVVIDRAQKFTNELSGNVYILGTNKYGEYMAAFLTSIGRELNGYINDYITETTYNSYQVIQSESVKKGASIINCIVEGRTIDAENSIRNLKPVANSNYFALQAAYPDDLPQIDFLSGTQSIMSNESAYKDLYERLEDEVSKKQFEDITNFRLTRNVDYLRGFEYKLKEQYFEPFIELNSTPVFIDGGGFDGETTRMFIELYPGYKRVFYFEPTEVSFLKSKQNLNRYQHIEFHQKGLWDKVETLFFDNSLGSASKVSDEGEIRIDTILIDDVVKERVDLIKLDIEGAEIKALTGAKKTILKYKPVIAVCVYHEQSDFINIPELILSYHPDYKVYLRHYTQGVFETVMYFV